MLDPIHGRGLWRPPAPLSQLATVSVPEPRLLSVQVWDRSDGPGPVDKAVRESDLGLNPQTEGQVLRIRIPELNEQRRKEMVKVAHKYAEEAKVAVRHVRRDGIDVVKKLEKDGDMTKDDAARNSDLVQKATDQHIAEIDQALAVEGKGNPARSDRAGRLAHLPRGSTSAAHPSGRRPAVRPTRNVS